LAALSEYDLGAIMSLQLKNLRKQAGMLQKDLAEKTGIRIRTIQSWEREEAKMGLDSACKIADALDCSLDELAGRKFNVEKYSDENQKMINMSYENMNKRGQERLAEQAHVMYKSGEYQSEDNKVSRTA